MRCILACIDLSASSDLVIDCALGLCGPEGQLVLLHVADPEPDFVGYGTGPQSVRQAVALELRKEHREVQRRAKLLAARGLSVTPLTVQGAVVEKILDQAERLGVDFIVLASKRHSSVYDLIVGSVLRGVVKGATAPVVLVPSRAPSALETTEPFGG
jgi:nucleotide-binding universal stress UspA family protein